MSRLSGRTALVTGAARGLGLRIAERFREEGAEVIVNDLNLAAAKAAAEPLGGFAVACDVSDPSSVRTMFEEIDRVTDQLDILVNNAGISGLEGDNAARERIAKLAAAQAAGEEPDEGLTGDFTDVDDDAWHRMIGIHMGGTFFCCREAVKRMRTKDGGGAIINMGSVMGTFGRPGGVAYSGAKSGILGMTRALAHELAKDAIRVNAIAPGWIHTDMTDPLAPMHPMLEAQTPLGRLGDPDDIAWAAVYLASEEAKFVTGQCLSPNGGWYMSQ